MTLHACPCHFRLFSFLDQKVFSASVSQAFRILVHHLTHSSPLTFSILKIFNMRIIHYTCVTVLQRFFVASPESIISIAHASETTFSQSCAKLRSFTFTFSNGMEFCSSSIYSALQLTLKNAHNRPTDCLSI
jgi:hypothetical protein